ncbi:Ankyrin repeats (many copies) [compost metagenome]
MIELLLEFGADVEGATPDGKTALMMAAMFNRVEVIRLLIERGANPNARDASGVTPLLLAQRMGAKEAVEALSAA